MIHSGQTYWSLAVSYRYGNRQRRELSRLMLNHPAYRESFRDEDAAKDAANRIAETIGDANAIDVCETAALYL